MCEFAVCMLQCENNVPYPVRRAIFTPMCCCESSYKSKYVVYINRFDPWARLLIYHPRRPPVPLPQLALKPSLESCRVFLGQADLTPIHPNIYRSSQALKAVLANDSPGRLHCRKV